jgi:hypothetical protein
MHFAFSIILIIGVRGKDRKPLYPWGKSSFDDRQEELLDSMRNNLVLKVKQNILPQFLMSTNETDREPFTHHHHHHHHHHLSVKNLEGVAFDIRLMRDIPNSNQTGPALAAITSVDTLNSILDNSCSLYAANYWNFEWCHRRQVTQVLN